MVESVQMRVLDLIAVVDRHLSQGHRTVRADDALPSHVQRVAVA